MPIAARRSALQTRGSVFGNPALALVGIREVTLDLRLALPLLLADLLDRRLNRVRDELSIGLEVRGVDKRVVTCLVRQSCGDFLVAGVQHLLDQLSRRLKRFGVA